ncbi:UNVERIFIED_CONTAM: hypothetical protein GTU68_060358 [Idotea baltica]|nr:hypothetical protein [Idotea baltica]
MIDYNQLIERLKKGEERALAKLITHVENRRPGSDEIWDRVYKESDNPHIIGITGSPGAGKSTLVDQLIIKFHEQNKKVAVIAVDPSSPFSGGAVLGDRIRMQDALAKTDVFIRSLATRGRLGGLAPATSDVIQLFGAAGFDIVIIETVGVGQAEVDIVKTADTCVVVLVPGMGDGVQALKAGVLEIADIFAINKAEKTGTSKLYKDIKTLLSLTTFKKENFDTPVLKTTATKGEGIDKLIEEIINHKKWLDTTDYGITKKTINLQTNILRLLTERVTENALTTNRDLFDELVEKCLDKKISPVTAVKKLLAK